MSKRYLVLQNGRVFEGEAFGADEKSVGELVFTTGMCGYIETLTDPSFYGQIVLQTFPLIGNYGMIPADFEGKCFVRGYVVREKCDTPSNFRCQGTLDNFLKENGIPGICGVDTREITKIIRESGVMNAVLTDSLPADTKALEAYRVTAALEAVSTKEIYMASSEQPKFRVALIDYGLKKNIVRELVRFGCDVTVYPHTAKASEILAENYDGVMLSNGPGDPSDYRAEIAEIAGIMGKKPMFGICLGHQLMALSQGGKTVKLKYGHRGVNQPVKDLCGARTFITSQNHGYAVVGESVPGGTVRYLNANDGTNEGMDYPALHAFSVQFHPEACSGPKDTDFLFERFCKLMGGENRAD